MKPTDLMLQGVWVSVDPFKH